MKEAKEAKATYEKMTREFELMKAQFLNDLKFVHK